MSDTLRLLVLCAGDPDSDRAFSGSARALISALAARGAVHGKANVLGFTDNFNPGGIIKQNLRLIDYLGLENRYRWSNIAFARNSRRAEAIAGAHPGFNACLMYGTTFRPQLGVPTYCYFDATAAQVAHAHAWEFADFNARATQRIIAYQKSVFDLCTSIFPRSDYAARSVRDDYGVPAGKIAVAGAGPNYLADALPHGPYDDPVLLFIGVDFERKGGPLIVEAFRRVRERIPRARLRIIGCEPEVSGPGIEVLGRIRRTENDGVHRLLEHYREAALFCMMSHFEPFGIVAIEAQHCGVPCVLPNRFAFPEMIQDGVTGALVDEYDPAPLAETLCALLADPGRLAQMGAAARAFVDQQWTWETAADRIIRRIAADTGLEASG